MSQSRDEMIDALKRKVVSVLRELGFKGSFPHFRRTSANQVQLLTFQFSMGGGQFVVELGKFPATGYQSHEGLIPPEKVKMRDLLRRLRLGAKNIDSDHWFNYDRGNYDEVAESIIPLIRGQAERWWARA
jgi:Domain of unknown function (DUF4304)